MLKKAVSQWNKINNYFIANIKNTRDSLNLWYAKGWQHIYGTKNLILDFMSKYGNWIWLILLAVLIASSTLLASKFQNVLESFFSDPGRLESIRALFLTVGGAMIGATAIAFSLIMFAMQVNVERMPHGLFKKFSSDIKLLGAFVLTFSLAMIITVFSLIPNESWVAGAILVTAWSSLLIILLYVLAYRRALALISPTIQLELVVEDTRKIFNIWDKAASRSTPIIREGANSKSNPEKFETKNDLDRAAYFHSYPNWTTSADKAVFYCTTYSRRYSEHGDHEVSQVALNGIVAINALYIKAKGRTFFSNSYIFDNPLSSDSFLRNTLEHLRQNVQVGISRRDERFIEQNMECLLNLTRLYLSIDYGDEQATRSHAHTASGYLADAVETVVPHGMADVLLEGITLLGSAACLIAIHDDPDNTTTLSKKIARIACNSATNSKYLPVTQLAVKQLATLTFELLRGKPLGSSFALREVRSNVKLIAVICLSIPDSPLTRVHSTSLAPYYSGTSNDTLIYILMNLTSALLKAESEDETAKRIIGNIANWADELYETEKELLVLSIERKSSLTIDLVYWVVHITNMLLRISCADACSEHHRDKLRSKAIWLIYVFSFIPVNEETINHLETHRIAEKLFRSALDAHNIDCGAEAFEIRDLLLSWTRMIGKYQTGWASLENACCGLACLNIILDLPDDRLFADIDNYISKVNAPNLEIRSRTASALHEEADNYHSGHSHSDIVRAMAFVDQSKLGVLLHGLAAHLCPEENQT